MAVYTQTLDVDAGTAQLVVEANGPQTTNEHGSRRSWRLVDEAKK